MSLANIFFPWFQSSHASGCNARVSLVFGFGSQLGWLVLCHSQLESALNSIVMDTEVFGDDQKKPIISEYSSKKYMGTSLPGRVGTAPDDILGSYSGSREQNGTGRMVSIEWRPLPKSTSCHLSLFCWTDIVSSQSLKLIPSSGVNSVFCICSNFNLVLGILKVDLTSCGSRCLFKQ